MSIPKFALILTLLALLAPWAAAADTPETVIRHTLEQARPDVQIESVTRSAVPGLYTVQFANGPAVYATADGKHFILGDLYQVGDHGFVNLAERERNAQRLQLLAAVKPADMVIYKASGTTKSVLTVFTDVDCGYCRKLHQEVPQLNAMGIEVRYLAYPRAGVGSATYRKMVSVWCSKNPQETLTRYKSGESLPDRTCKDNPVAMEYQLGERMGVDGTPTLIMPDGRLLPGYLPAPQLAQALGVR